MRKAEASLYLLVVLAAAVLVIPAAAQGADDTLFWPIRGFNYPSWWHDEYLGQSSSDSLSRIAATGANWVAIDPTQYMDTAVSNTMAPENGGVGRTASDAAVARAIDDAHARGLKVMLKPHIDISDGTTRWDIQPTDPQQWFANYKNMMAGYAMMAEAHHVDLLSVGTELVTLSSSDNNGYWADVIAGVRSVYRGPVTYSASTTECDSLGFADLLDVLGLDVYFPLSDNAEPTLAELVAGWTDYHGYYGDGNWLASIEQCQAQWNKPVVLTELGYRSVKYVGLAPWDWSAGVYDGNNQARAYEAAFEVLGNKAWLAGVFWWDWMPDADSGGPGDTDYTIAGKPAEEVVKSWYALEAAPQAAIQADLKSASWKSFADYMSRNLSVAFDIENTGSGSATGITITESRATAGVLTLSSLPAHLGTLDPGNSRATTVTYRVPAGVATFRVNLDITFLDAFGLPLQYPGMVTI